MSPASARYGTVYFYRKNGSLSLPYTLTPGLATIGTSVDSSIRLKSTDFAKDSVCCAIDVKDDGLVILENRSTLSPVLLNGAKLKGASVLCNGDSFEVAGKIFKYVGKSASDKDKDKVVNLGIANKRQSALPTFKVSAVSSKIPVTANCSRARKKRSLSLTETKDKTIETRNKRLCETALPNKRSRSVAGSTLPGLTPKVRKSLFTRSSITPAATPYKPAAGNKKILRENTPNSVKKRVSSGIKVNEAVEDFMSFDSPPTRGNPVAKTDTAKRMSSRRISSRLAPAEVSSGLREFEETINNITSHQERGIAGKTPQSNKRKSSGKSLSHLVLAEGPSGLTEIEEVAEVFNTSSTNNRVEEIGDKTPQPNRRVSTRNSFLRLTPAEVSSAFAEIEGTPALNDSTTSSQGDETRVITPHSNKRVSTRKSSLRLASDEISTGFAEMGETPALNDSTTSSRGEKMGVKTPQSNKTISGRKSSSRLVPAEVSTGFPEIEEVAEVLNTNPTDAQVEEVDVKTPQPNKTVSTRKSSLRLAPAEVSTVFSEFDGQSVNTSTTSSQGEEISVKAPKSNKKITTRKSSLRLAPAEVSAGFAEIEEVRTPNTSTTSSQGEGITVITPQSNNIVSTRKSSLRLVPADLSSGFAEIEDIQAPNVSTTSSQGEEIRVITPQSNKKVSTRKSSLHLASAEGSTGFVEIEEVQTLSSSAISGQGAQTRVVTPQSNSRVNTRKTSLHVASAGICTGFSETKDTPALNSSTTSGHGEETRVVTPQSKKRVNTRNSSRLVPVQVSTGFTDFEEVQDLNSTTTTPTLNTSTTSSQGEETRVITPQSNKRVSIRKSSSRLVPAEVSTGFAEIEEVQALNSSTTSNQGAETRVITPQSNKRVSTRKSSLRLVPADLSSGFAEIEEIQAPNVSTTSSQGEEIRVITPQSNKKDSTRKSSLRSAPAEVSTGFAEIEETQALHSSTTSSQGEEMRVGTPQFNQRVSTRKSSLRFSPAEVSAEFAEIEVQSLNTSSTTISQGQEIRVTQPQSNNRVSTRKSSLRLAPAEVSAEFAETETHALISSATSIQGEEIRVKTPQSNKRHSKVQPLSVTAIRNSMRKRSLAYVLRSPEFSTGKGTPIRSPSSAKKAELMRSSRRSFTYSDSQSEGEDFEMDNNESATSTYSVQTSANESNKALSQLMESTCEGDVIGVNNNGTPEQHNTMSSNGDLSDVRIDLSQSFAVSESESYVNHTRESSPSINTPDASLSSTASSRRSARKQRGHNTTNTSAVSGATPKENKPSKIRGSKTPAIENEIIEIDDSVLSSGKKSLSHNISNSGKQEEPIDVIEIDDSMFSPNKSKSLVQSTPAPRESQTHQSLALLRKSSRKNIFRSSDLMETPIERVIALDTTSSSKFVYSQMAAEDSHLSQEGDNSFIISKNIFESTPAPQSKLTASKRRTSLRRSSAVRQTFSKAQLSPVLDENASLEKSPTYTPVSNVSRRSKLHSKTNIEQSENVSILLDDTSMHTNHNESLAKSSFSFSASKLLHTLDEDIERDAVSLLEHTPGLQVKSRTSRLRESEKIILTPVPIDKVDTRRSISVSKNRTSIKNNSDSFSTPISVDDRVKNESMKLPEDISTHFINVTRTSKGFANSSSRRSKQVSFSEPLDVTTELCDSKEELLESDNLPMINLERMSFLETMPVPHSKSMTLNIRTSPRKIGAPRQSLPVLLLKRHAHLATPALKKPILTKEDTINSFESENLDHLVDPDVSQSKTFADSTPVYHVTRRSKTNEQLGASVMKVQSQKSFGLEAKSGVLDGTLSIPNTPENEVAIQSASSVLKSGRKRPSQMTQLSDVEEVACPLTNTPLYNNMKTRRSTLQNPASVKRLTRRSSLANTPGDSVTKSPKMTTRRSTVPTPASIKGNSRKFSLVSEQLVNLSRNSLDSSFLLNTTPARNVSLRTSTLKKQNRSSALEHDSMNDSSKLLEKEPTRNISLRNFTPNHSAVAAEQSMNASVKKATPVGTIQTRRSALQTPIITGLYDDLDASSGSKGIPGQTPIPKKTQKRMPEAVQEDVGSSTFESSDFMTPADTSLEEVQPMPLTSNNYSLISEATPGSPNEAEASQRGIKRGRETMGSTAKAVKRQKLNNSSEDSDDFSFEGSFNSAESSGFENITQEESSILHGAKSPRNDLTNVSGVKYLMKTRKLPTNDLTDVRGVKQLMKTPKVQKPPNNDLRNIKGVKKLLATPKVQNSPVNDLTQVVGVKRLMRTPKVQKSPKNDLTEIKGVKKVFASPRAQRSPANDLRDVRGVKGLLGSPKVHSSPNNDLTNVAGVKKIFKTPKNQKSPLNDLRNVQDIRYIFNSKVMHKSPLNDLTNVDGIKDLWEAEKGINEGPRGDIFDTLVLPNLKTYARKSSPMVKNVIDDDHRQSDTVAPSPRVDQWVEDSVQQLEEMKNVVKTKNKQKQLNTSVATPSNSNELQINSEKVNADVMTNVRVTPLRTTRGTRPARYQTDNVQDKVDKTPKTPDLSKVAQNVDENVLKANIFERAKEDVVSTPSPKSTRRKNTRTQLKTDGVAENPSIEDQKNQRATRQRRKIVNVPKNTEIQDKQLENVKDLEITNVQDDKPLPVDHAKTRKRTNRRKNDGEDTKQEDNTSNAENEAPTNYSTAHTRTTRRKKNVLEDKTDAELEVPQKETGNTQQETDSATKQNAVVPRTIRKKKNAVKDNKDMELEKGAKKEEEVVAIKTTKRATRQKVTGDEQVPITEVAETNHVEEKQIPGKRRGRAVKTAAEEQTIVETPPKRLKTVTWEDDAKQSPQKEVKTRGRKKQENDTDKETLQVRDEQTTSSSAGDAGSRKTGKTGKKGANVDSNVQNLDTKEVQKTLSKQIVPETTPEPKIGNTTQKKTRSARKVEHEGLNDQIAETTEPVVVSMTPQRKTRGTKKTANEKDTVSSMNELEEPPKKTRRAKTVTDTDNAQSDITTGKTLEKSNSDSEKLVVEKVTPLRITRGKKALRFIGEGEQVTNEMEDKKVTSPKKTRKAKLSKKDDIESDLLESFASDAKLETSQSKRGRKAKSNYTDTLSPVKTKTDKLPKAQRQAPHISTRTLRSKKQ